MRTIFISAVVTAACILVACGSDEGEEDARVVATTGILADIASAVAGDAVAVDQLVPDGSSPHDFQLSAEDRRRLEEADLIVANGAGLEAGIPLDELGAPVWELSRHAGELLPDDPHVWMDPARVAAALPSLARALGDAGASGSADLAGRAEAYASKLDAVDAELQRKLRQVPGSDRELVTSHDSLGYFADRYGFSIAATAFPASGPEAEVGAGQLQEVIEAVEDADVATVFASEEDDPETLRQVAEAAGVEIEEGLTIESLGDAGGYVELLRRDADLIAAGLTPG
jgi:ABC-type Zn uptake system ZnuABC Zn-binding protein ZnuA